MFTHLLVPLDGSTEASMGLIAARTLASALGARLTLTRVIEEDDRPALRWAALELEHLATELRESGLAVSTTVRNGEVAETLVSEAQRASADLIVMATHGRSGLTRMMAGSVAQGVLARSHLPVLLARPGSRHVVGVRSLLVPVDGTPEGAVALGVAGELARATSATMTVVQAVPPIQLTAVDPYGSVSYDPQWEEDARVAAETYVMSLAKGLEQSGLHAEGQAVLGEPSAVIVEAADRLHTDLIVMSTHARHGVARALLGSVADAVVRTANCPVLLLPMRLQARHDP